MKLIIQQYLYSLKERDELDAVLPDLLSQLGLNVYSRPARGTRQDGVDVGAVGSLNGGGEKVYLFSIKSGDLTRKNWNGDSTQSLRPSLDEIIDSYIPNRLPIEHRGKDIVICIAIGGDVQEPVRSDVTGYIERNTKANVTFEEWNGGKLADLIQSSFLREDLLPEHARSHLRKSLAMLDEPDVSYRHFAQLIRSLSAADGLSDAQRITSIRQMSICLWILYAWAREAENTEAAYHAGELTLLHAWGLVKPYAGQDNKTSRAMNAAVQSIFTAYNQICSEFLRVNVLSCADKLHAMSVAVRGSCSLDVNLKLFDLVGRLGIDGLWAYWGAQRCPEDQAATRDAALGEAQQYANAIKALINNNPALLLPARDEQAIDLSIALSLLIIDGSNREFILSWLGEMLARAKFAYEAHTKYPSVLRSYTELLEHPKSREKEYRENATTGSILYPVIALWAALLEDEQLHGEVANVQELMKHCTYQLWYPDELSEDHLYKNSDSHGAMLSNLDLNISVQDFLAQVFRECEETKHFEELSAVKYGWWPLIIVACRHYRLPLPLHLLRGLRAPAESPQ